ncbi:hypothetical protein BAAM0483_07610 [Bifidobacterium animalis subsp. animalis MCC 0483]|uniref:Helicase ATP-binding domain-containing protein n=1 Tax=Bifidobacterium animalis subsp. animalis MCC 0483 TaxID=1365955 RepID=A0AB34T888_9BIFI|nr:SNF2-related protein [Bifidobacterium animalis]KOA48764.1 hypothetical protein BAAM0483_07610 [Bifidobacterium animalis subsp. animalis MCC 0483]
MTVKATLHDYQAQAVRFALHTLPVYGGCGLFLDMGLGKTLTTIAILDIIHRLHPEQRFLIVAPKTVAVNTWPAELAKWEHTLDWAVAAGEKPDAKQRETALAAQATVTIINQDNLGWLDTTLTEWPWDGIVLDELSGYKNANSKRFRILRRRKQDRTRPERGRGKGQPTGWILGLTGTPAAKGLIDLWPQCALLDDTHRLGRTITAYRSTYFTPGRHHGHVVYEWKPRPDAFTRIMGTISPYCLTMLAKDQLPDLPQVIMQDHHVTMPAGTRQAYRRFCKDKYEELTDTHVTAVNAGVLTGKLSQFTAGCLYPDMDAPNRTPIRYDQAKMSVVNRIIAEAQGNPVLVFYQYKDELARLRETYGTDVHTPDEPDIVRRWDAGEIPILAAHPLSARYGLNLQHAGHIIIWMSLPWSVEDWQQANARLNRQGQTRPVQIHRIIEPDTIDERKLAVLEQRAMLQDAVMAELKHAAE